MLDFADAVHGTTLPLTLRAPGVCDTCHGNGAKPGTRRDLPAVPGSGLVTRNQGSFSFSEPCRECQGVGTIVEEKCPECQRHRRGHQDPHAQRPLPAGRRRRPADPAGRPGRAGRARRPGRRPLRAGEGAPATTCSGARRRPDAHRADHVRRSGPRHRPAGADDGRRGDPAGAARHPSGRTLRARGKGVVRRDGQAGDLLVTVEVVVRRTLSEEARDALESFAGRPRRPAGALDARVRRYG